MKEVYSYNAYLELATPSLMCHYRYRGMQIMVCLWLQRKKSTLFRIQAEKSLCGLTIPRRCTHPEREDLPSPN